MEPLTILNNTSDEFIEQVSNDKEEDVIDYIRRPKPPKDKFKENLIVSINGAIVELNQITKDFAEQLNLSTDTSHINSMIYNSLLMLIDELDFIMQYIQKIEDQIDITIFEIAKKLNESIVNLIGHRKDILFRVIETSCKIHDYIIKWKKIVNDTEATTEEETGWFEKIKRN